MLALYLDSPDIQALHHRPKAVWMLCILVLYWISWVWMTVDRGDMPDDPVIYALRDPVGLGPETVPKPFAHTLLRLGEAHGVR